VSKKKPKHLGGKELSVPAFLEGQNCNGTAAFYITREEFEEGKSCGEILPINHGKAALIKRHTQRPDMRTPRNLKSRWVIAGQTKPGYGPGFPGFQYI
jgi:hypothetical protein